MPLAFNDWYDIIGTGIQSLFAWTTFNRDAFADNVGWRQNQRYQQKNYHISWISVARDDIRDMMSISVNRLNNFMIVNGLILGVAGSAITSASFNIKCSPYLVAAFLVSIATAIVFLVLAIMFGIKGQNCAFTNTMKLLTWEMRPENPADYNHDYMSQAQWIEKNGLLQMFRIPGMMPNYKTDPRAEEHELPEHMRKLKAQTAETGQYKKSAARHGATQGTPQDGTNYVAEDFTALEHLEVSSTSLWYLTKFGYFMRLWMPYDTHCKYAMGMGMLSLGHAGAYFTMGTILSGGWDVPWYAGVGSSFTFVYMVALVIQQNFKDMGWQIKLVTTLLLCLGPTLGVYAATTKVNLLHKYLWMGCFFFHFSFWSAAYFATFNKKVLRASSLGAVGTQGGFWGKHEEEHYAKHQGNAAQAPPGDPTVLGNGNGSHQGTGDKSPRDDWSDWEDSGSDYSTDDDGSNSHSTKRSEAYKCRDPYSGAGMSSPSGAAASSSSGAAGAAGGGDRPQAVSHDKVISGTGRWPTDDARFGTKVDDTSLKVRAALQQTIIVVALCWVALLIWVITQTFIIDEESPFRRVYASELAQPVSWPSPFLRPTRIACPDRAGAVNYQFLSDDYRIFRLSASSVTEVSCNLSSTIRDLSSYCEGSCWPVVLTEDNQIVDCQRGTAESLLQDPREASLVSVYTTSPGRPLREQRLIVSPGEGTLVMYQWSTPKGGWVPEHELTVPGEATSSPVAIDVSGDRLLLFYSVLPDLLSVYRRDLKNMMFDGGPWALSPAAAPVRGGCAFDGANKAMVLPQVASHMSAPTVVRLDLSKTHSAFVNS